MSCWFHHLCVQKDVAMLHAAVYAQALNVKNIEYVINLHEREPKRHVAAASLPRWLQTVSSPAKDIESKNANK